VLQTDRGLRQVGGPKVASTSPANRCSSEWRIIDDEDGSNVLVEAAGAVGFVDAAR